jgi:hypothetical protein
MNQDMSTGIMMLCIASGVLFSLLILVLVIVQRILGENSSRSAPNHPEIKAGCKFVARITRRREILPKNARFPKSPCVFIEDRRAKAFSGAIALHGKVSFRRL